jgi:hypothetical protein
VLSSGNTADDLGKPAVHPYKKKEPVLILDQHIVVNDMRLLDILKKYDPDGAFQVTPDDFVKAVEVIYKILLSLMQKDIMLIHCCVFVNFIRLKKRDNKQNCQNTVFKLFTL